MYNDMLESCVNPINPLFTCCIQPKKCTVPIPFFKFLYTVKPVLSGHSKIDITKILMTNGSLMKVESIAECSPWSILQYF